jgi:hypothetical protein
LLRVVAPPGPAQLTALPLPLEQVGFDKARGAGQAATVSATTVVISIPASYQLEP